MQLVLLVHIASTDFYGIGNFRQQYLVLLGKTLSWAHFFWKTAKLTMFRSTPAQFRSSSFGLWRRIGDRLLCTLLTRWTVGGTRWATTTSLPPSTTSWPRPAGRNWATSATRSAAASSSSPWRRTRNLTPRSAESGSCSVLYLHILFHKKRFPINRM